MDIPEISIIIPCRNEGNNVFNTVSSIINTPTSIDFELIVIDDGSSDRCCEQLLPQFPDRIRLLNSYGTGACSARNKGAYYARGKYLLFCDAHIFAEPHWLEKLLVCFSEPEVGIVSPGISSPKYPETVGYGLTLTEDFSVEWNAHPGGVSEILIAPGGCALVRRDTFRQLGGFDRGLRVWGHEDVEISLRYWMFGYQVLVNSQVKIMHVFREKHPYHVSMENIYYNYLRIALSHFKPARVKKILGFIKSDPHAEEIISDVILSDVWYQRQRFKLKRRFNDDWLFNKFSVPF